MMKVSEHFSREEFACACGCGFAAVDVELLQVLEAVRTAFGGRPVTITSGCRCARHNESEQVGGAPDSMHVKGMAADFVVQGEHADEVAAFLEREFPRCGIGRYVGRTHVDVRGRAARWDNRGGK